MTAPMRNSTRAMISTHLRASTKSPTPPRISARISSTAIHIGAPFVQRTPITPPYRPQNAPPRISPRGVGVSPPRPEGVCLPGAGMRRALSGSVPHDRREWGKVPRPACPLSRRPSGFLSGSVPHDRREWGKVPQPERSGGWGRGYLGADAEARQMGAVFGLLPVTVGEAPEGETGHFAGGGLRLEDDIDPVVLRGQRHLHVAIGRRGQQIGRHLLGEYQEVGEAVDAQTGAGGPRRDQIPCQIGPRGPGCEGQPEAVHRCDDTIIFPWASFST